MSNFPSSVSGFLQKASNYKIDLPALALFAAPALGIIAATLWQTNGNFTYTMDDPYIHLALAKNIFQGHYGINSNEMSAPASSILWPFLISPFSLTPFFNLVPLIINVLFTACSLYLIFQSLSQYVSRNWSISLSLFIGVCLNFYGLAVSGMEHSLQVLLCIIIAISVAENKYNNAFWISITLLPLIRYEGLAISIPVFCYLLLNKQTRTKSLVFATVSLGAVLSFSLFLLSNKLGYLPSSVLAKSPYLQLSTKRQIVMTLIGNAVWTNLGSRATLVITTIGAIAAGFLWNSGKSKTILTLLAPLVLHILFGSNGWFGRYEIYILSYVIVLSIVSIFEINGMSVSKTNQGQQPLYPVLVGFLAILLIATPQLMYCTFYSPAGSVNILNQQAQMGVIVKNYIRDNVAVNDLGLVVLNSDHYVLDLWGLGSQEILNYRRKNADPKQYIKSVMYKRNTKYAIIYDEWFPAKPDNWIKVATLRLPPPRITPASDAVSFYATDPQSADKLASSLQEYVNSNELGSTFLEVGHKL